MVYEDAKSADAALQMLTNRELDGRKIFLRKVCWLAGLLVFMCPRRNQFW